MLSFQPKPPLPLEILKTVFENRAPSEDVTSIDTSRYIKPGYFYASPVQSHQIQGEEVVSCQSENIWDRRLPSDHSAVA